VSVPTAGPGNSADVLKEAGRLADQGKFAEANQLCQKYLNANPCSAEAYFLLGLIAEASGQPQEAEGKYLRALYLDRKHQEALVHLALMLEARGDLAGAVALRRRLERAESGK
jgi:chemotaxis protein methyltransferase WspC